MDPVQLFGSLAAILVTAFIAARMFPVKNPLDDDRVRRNLLRYEPDAVVRDILVSSDGQAALAQLDTPAGSLGLAVQLGDRVVCRILHGADIKKVETSQGKLVIHFDDFTQPSVTLPFDEDQLTTAHELVKDMAAPSMPEDASHAA